MCTSRKRPRLNIVKRNHTKCRAEEERIGLFSFSFKSDDTINEDIEAAKKAQEAQMVAVAALSGKVDNLGSQLTMRDIAHLREDFVGGMTAVSSHQHGGAPSATEYTGQIRSPVTSALPFYLITRG